VREVRLKGYLYILKNPAHKEDLYKIGRTSRKPETRASELSQPTAVAEPFKVIFYREFEDVVKAEKYIFDELSYYRVSSNREFFDLPLHIAVQAIDDYYISLLKKELHHYKRQTEELSVANDSLKLYQTNKTVGPSRLLLDYYSLYVQADAEASEKMFQFVATGSINRDDVAFGKIRVSNHSGFIMTLLLNGVFCETSSDFTLHQWTMDEVQIRIPQSIFLPIPHKNYEAKCVYAETFVKILRNNGIRALYQIERTNFT